MDPTNPEVFATILFGIAIIHTFTVSYFEKLAHKYPEGSVGENLFHVLGEVEVVFGLWAGVFVIGLAAMAGGTTAIDYMEGNLPGYAVNYTEPVFVFAIMTVAATRPVIELASAMISAVAKLLPLPGAAGFFVVALILGPLLGSFITEPAAMTVTALILKDRFYERGISAKLMYATIGVLFVNISIGGTLTNFAAPPVLMVAGPEKFNWDLMHMVTHFGWKSSIAVVINAVGLLMLFRNEISKIDAGPTKPDRPRAPVPFWLTLLHLLFMAGVVAMAHHMVAFLGIFLFFLGVTAVTEEYQDELKLKEGLLVGFFLGGLVTLGGFQKWWLQPILSDFSEVPLFLGSTALTAITDNAALTYLGSLVEGLTDPMKYALVAGAVAGGGLTVIANAPNPAGFGILKSSFGPNGINPLKLFLYALIPTGIGMACLWFLPSL